ncbi:MAG: class I SAM-dependent methyltransferase [Oscillospiraceae bacterium]|nr:class I SAM-dependent methyltransferase [Oscillospiraceae bacterium]
MTGRLTAIYHMLPETGIGVIDVGTDHGMIPLALAKAGYPGNLIASDLREGPLHKAEEAAAQQHLDKRIRFLLCDGLDLCPPRDVDCVVIAGMGGDNICGILDRAEWIMNGGIRLVLQPMTHPEVLRYWLLHNEFRIDREELVREDGRLYQVFSAVSGRGEKLTDACYLIGGLNLPRDRALLKELAGAEFSRLQKKTEGLRKSGLRDLFYENIQNELREIRDGL